MSKLSESKGYEELIKSISEEKDDIMIEYAMLNDKARLIVSKYQLYLPDAHELKMRVKEIIDKK